MPAASKLERAADLPLPAPFDEQEYMSPAQLEYFRNLLLDWKQSLLEGAGRTVNHMQDDSATHPDPNDRATQERNSAWSCAHVTGSANSSIKSMPC